MSTLVDIAKANELIQDFNEESVQDITNLTYRLPILLLSLMERIQDYGGVIGVNMSTAEWLVRQAARRCINVPESACMESRI